MLYGAVVTGEPRFAPSSLNCTLAMLTLEVAVAATFAAPETVWLAVGAVIDTTGGATPLFTNTLTLAEVVGWWIVSVATADKRCGALLAVVVSQEMLYGAVVTGEPKFTPSSMNWTLAIPALEFAVADTVVEPETVWFAVGAVIETVGGGVELSTLSKKIPLRTALDPAFLEISTTTFPLRL